MKESSTLAQRFLALAQSQPSHLAIRFGMPGQTEDIDFAKFWRRVERVTGHLQASFGLQAGQRVAWLGLNQSPDKPVLTVAFVGFRNSHLYLRNLSSQ